ncbi:hypothetical protein [Acidithiobacillus ferriphilus]|uniref:hypothetical protein n=1 Tax=Acidithiobacillus ferriphilus TaxID=1689834 RepID=UPI002DBD3A8C|nr:hypothetical protein [Acidithiobacillus ferriphilus]MEB8536826.1 hypothetical protein [Acidithiobacillus ferriphilus]
MKKNPLRCKARKARKAMVAIAIIVTFPTAANATLRYDFRAYGSVSNLAFSNMYQPELGLSLKIARPHHHDEYIAIHTRLAARNADPNGGAEGVLSAYAGDKFLHTKIAEIPLTAGLYAGYQHLWYGPLYNNAVGGGLRLQTKVLGLILTGKVGALYGLSGTVGWHLNCPGNDFVFYGRAAYPVNKNLSVFGFVRQERYVGNGDALTSRDAGMGFQAKF